MTSPASSGDPTWTDPRWATDTGTRFARGFSLDAASYVALFDRATNDLVVTFRIWSAIGEEPTPADWVYFGITSNVRGSSFSAHDTRVPLIGLAPGDNARPITSYESAVFANGSWSLQASSDGWISDVAAWRGTEGSELAWAVSLRVDLEHAGIDPASDFRIALKVHLDGRGELFSPGNRAQLSDTPTDWSTVNLPSSPCVIRVAL
jgi:hypothetical protein